VWGDAVFFADGVGDVTARDQRTGQVLWSRDSQTGGRIVGYNLLAQQGVVVAPGAFEVVAFDAASGADRWRYEPPLDTLNPFAQPPQPGFMGSTRLDADETTVYIPAWGASISAVDLQTGQLRWVWGDGNPGGFRSGSMGVRVHGDTVYAPVWHNVNQFGGLSEVWLVALERATGRELWRKVFPAYTSGVSTQGSPAVFENLVIFTSAGGYEYAVDRFTTELVWQFTPTPVQATLSQPELWGDVVYHDGGDQYIYALDARSGAVRWRALYEGLTYTDFLVTERRIYVANGQRILVVLDRATGAVLARRYDPTGNDLTGLYSTPGIYADGRVFIGLQAGVGCYLER
jgi:outer membrane protein assembly factor BamB